MILHKAGKTGEIQLKLFFSSLLFEIIILGSFLNQQFPAPSLIYNSTSF